MPGKRFQIMTVLLGSDGRLLYVSPSASDLLGYHPSELIGSLIWEHTHPEDRERLRQAILTHSEELEGFVYRSRRKTGGDLWLEALFHPSLDPVTQAHQGITGTIRDVSDRKSWEAQLRASEEKHRAILDTCADAILLANAETGRIKEVNAEAARLFACSEEDLIGLHQSELHPPEIRESCKRTFREHIEKGLVRVPDMAIQRDDGLVVPVAIMARPTVIGGEPTLVGFFRDITCRKERERELIEARIAAEAANRAKSEFLGSMSHELRTPLNAVIGFSDIIAQEAFGPVGQDRYRDYAQDIRNSGQHLLDLITEILDHAKADAGQLTIYESFMDLTETVDFALRMVALRAEREGVRLESTVAPEVRCLWADEQRLRQILVNLLSNAVKFTPAGGCISLRAEREAKGGLRLTVSDTGIGIAAEDIPRVLEPFVQVKCGAGGTGLGLPLAKTLAELHGGRLALTSEAGKGTTVTLRLPAERVRRQPCTTAAAAGREVQAGERSSVA